MRSRRSIINDTIAKEIVLCDLICIDIVLGCSSTGGLGSGSRRSLGSSGIDERNSLVLDLLSGKSIAEEGAKCALAHASLLKEFFKVVLGRVSSS